MENPFKLLDIVALNSLADNMDDRTLFNFCKTDKYFRKKICEDENFWKNRLRKRYPLLEKFKEERDKYRVFYAFMVKFIAKIEEGYGIPYIPAKNFNPYTFYWNENANINKALFYAGETNRKDIVDLLVQKGGKLADAMHGAIMENNFDMIQYLISKDYKPSFADLMFAADKGNLDIVEFLSDRATTDFIIPLRWAVKAGHIDIVKYFVENKGIRDGLSLELAKKYKRKDIVEYLEKID